MKKLLLFLILACAAHGQILGPILSASTAAAAPCSGSDTFTGAVSTLLTVHSASWTATQNNFLLDGGGGIEGDTGSAASMAFWNACTPTATQFSQGTVGVITDSNYIGVAVRVQAGTHQGYRYVCNATGSCYLQVENGGSETTLSGPVAACPTAKVMRLEVSGNNLTAKCDGAQVMTGTDATFTTGKVGVAGYGAGNNTIKSWSGGDL